jgi:hypothetical protein
MFYCECTNLLAGHPYPEEVLDAENDKEEHVHALSHAHGPSHAQRQRAACVTLRLTKGNAAQVKDTDVQAVDHIKDVRAANA